MIKAGDILLIQNYTFKVERIEAGHATIVWSDKHGITHFRRIKVANIFQKIEFKAKVS